MKPSRVFLTAVAALVCIFQFSGALRADIVLSEDQVKDIVAGSPGLAEYPQAGAIVLYSGWNEREDGDGSSVMTHQVLVKILQDRGRNEFSDQKINFDSDTDSVEVVVARTWLPDLSTVPVEPKAINVITYPEATEASMYADIKQKVISYPSIAPGVTIELVTRTIYKPEQKDIESEVATPYWDTQLFRMQEPILSKVFELDLGKGAAAPKIEILNGLSPAVTSNDDGRTVYRWSVENSPMIIAEPHMPESISYVPAVAFSSLDSWDRLGKFISERFYPSIEPDEAIRTKVSELTAGARSAADSVRAIALFVVKDIRSIGLPLGLAGWRPNPAAEVFANRYGDIRDKTVLLAAMLEAAGFEGYPALMSSDQKDLLIREVPSPDQFDRMGVYLPGTFVDSTFSNRYYDGSLRDGLWLIPTGSYNKYGFYSLGQDVPALVVKPDGGSLMNTADFPSTKNLTFNEYEISIAGNGDLSGKIETVTDGLFDGRLRSQIKDLTPAERDKLFQQFVNAIGESAELVDYKVSDLEDLAATASVSLEYKAPELGVVQKDMMIVHLPIAPFSFSNLPYTPELQERSFDFVSQGRFALLESFLIKLPAGWKVAYLADQLEAETPFGNWRITSGKANGAVTFTRRMEVSTRWVTLDNYAEFKKFMDGFSLPKNTLLLLEKTN